MLMHVHAKKENENLWFFELQLVGSLVCTAWLTQIAYIFNYLYGQVWISIYNTLQI